MGLIVFVALCFGGPLIRQFFISRKLNSMTDVYKELNTASAMHKLDSESFDLMFKKISENNNISIVLVDSDSETIKSSGQDYEYMSRLLLGYLFDSSDPDSQALQKSARYEAYLTSDPRNGIEYIDMWGILDDGTLFLLRSPLGSIVQNAELTKNILVFFLISIALVLLVIFLIISRRVTVSELREDNLRLQKDIELKEKNENMRREFLSNISHELKTPIALIQGYAEGLKESVNKDEQSKDFYCDVIMDEASKMNKIVKNLLDLNQLEFGQTEFSNDVFDIVSLIKNYIQQSEIIFEQKGINVTIDAPDSAPVLADEYYTEEIFNNYITNAINYVSGDKRIIVSITDHDEARYRISVFDTGDRIPEESIERIWDKFYKVDKARTREYGGSGVGLSIAKAIADKMGQSYGVENHEDGVSFYFTLNKAK